MFQEKWAWINTAISKVARFPLISPQNQAFLKQTSPQFRGLAKTSSELFSTCHGSEPKKLSTDSIAIHPIHPIPSTTDPPPSCPKPAPNPKPSNPDRVSSRNPGSPARPALSSCRTFCSWPLSAASPVGHVGRNPSRSSSRV